MNKIQEIEAIINSWTKDEFIEILKRNGHEFGNNEQNGRVIDIEYAQTCENFEECYAFHAEEYDMCRFCTRSKLNEEYSDRFSRWMTEEDSENDIGCTGYIKSTGLCDIDNTPCDMCATTHVKFGQ